MKNYCPRCKAVTEHTAMPVTVEPGMARYFYKCGCGLSYLRGYRVEDTGLKIILEVPDAKKV